MKIPTGLAGEIKERAKQASIRAIYKGMDLALNAVRRASSQGPLFAKTGNLARSWDSSGVKVESNRVSADLVSSAPYWRIHETGGKIVPVQAKHLTIPILDNLTPAGVPRYASVALLEQAMGKGKVFMFKSKKGNLIIGAGGGKKKHGELKAFFVLKDKVEIKATHYIQKATKEVQPKVVALIARELANADKK